MSGGNGAFSVLVPPHDWEIEQAVLGAALLDSEAAHLVASSQPSMFFAERHRLLAETIRGLVRTSQPVDLLTVSATLQAAGTLAQVGGAAALATLVDVGATTANIEGYVARIQKRAARRELLRIGMDVVSEAKNPAGSPTEDLIATSVRRLTNLDAGGLDVIVRPGDLASDLAEPAVAGLETGLALIDDLCDGLHPGNLLVIAGRPGMGKTALGLQLAHTLGVRQRHAVLFCSLEMTRKEIGWRLLSLETGINAQLVRQGLAEPDRMDAGRATLAASGFHIMDEAAPTLSHLQAWLRQARQRHGALLAIIDHIGKIRVDRRESRYLEVGEIAQGLKATAKQLAMPVIALAQLNRLVERRNSPRPQLADLRDAGTIEEEADAVVFLWTAEERPEGIESLPINLFLAKNRHGRTGERGYVFRKSCGRFAEQSHRDDVVAGRPT